MANQFDFNESLDALINDPRARKLAQSTLEAKNVDKMSLAQLKSYSVELFDALMSPGLTGSERQSAIAINHYVSKKTAELGGVNTNLMANSEAGFNELHEIQKHNAQENLREARISGNQAHIEQFQLEVDNLANVDRAIAGEPLEPVFSASDDLGREKYIRGGNRPVTVVKTSEEHLSSPPASQLTVADSRSERAAIAEATAREAGRI